MIRLIWLLCLLAATAGHALPGDDWRRSPKPIRDAVRATVEGQLAAIRTNDFGKAYEFAAESIRARFTPAVFAAMIRRGYPALVRHTEANVGAVRDDGQHRAQASATVRDKLDRNTSYRYHLIEEADGWRVEGVVPEIATPHGEI